MVEKSLSRRDFNRLFLLSTALTSLSGSGPQELTQPNTQQALLIAAGLPPQSKVRLKFRSGDHYATAYDAQHGVNTGEIKFGSSPNISQLIVDYLAPKATDNPETTIAPLQRSLPEIFDRDLLVEISRDDSVIPPSFRLGQGGYRSQTSRNQTRQNMRDQKVVSIATDLFGNLAFSAEQIGITTAVTAVEATALHVLIARHGWQRIFQTFSPRASQSSEDKPKETKGLSRRAFLEAGSLVTSGAVLWGANKLALDQGLGRHQIDPMLGHAWHQVISFLPSEIIGLFDERVKQVFLSTLHLRNLNIALNLYPTALASSYSDQINWPNDSQDILVKFGLFHSDIEYQFHKGQLSLKQDVELAASALIQTMADDLAQAQESRQVYQILKDWLYTSAVFSPVVADNHLGLDPNLVLPESGSSILWQRLLTQTHTAKLTGDRHQYRQLIHMLKLKARYDARVIKSLSTRARGFSDPIARGWMGYSNVHQLNLQRPATVYLPEDQLGSDDPDQPILLFQDNYPYFLFGEIKNERLQLSGPASDTLIDVDLASRQIIRRPDLFEVRVI